MLSAWDCLRAQPARSLSSDVADGLAVRRQRTRLHGHRLQFQCTAELRDGRRMPRFFVRRPSGTVLFVLNEDSGSVVALRVNPSDGRLSPTGAILSCGSPVCMVFRT